MGKFCFVLYFDNSLKPKTKKYMKFKINLSFVVLIGVVFSSLLLLGSCNNDDSKCCEGYTGKVTGPQAESLQKRCHFIDKDTIAVWVARYEKYKEQLGRKQDYKTSNQDTTNTKADEMKAAMDEMSLLFLKGGSISYNSCIVKKILCDKRSIGLRVLYGIGPDNRIHIILVGINADYSNLYVEAEDCCPDPLNKTLGAGLTKATGASGGAEYGQMP
jgi:Fe-S cluster assembly iron-binding protein IscA